MASREHVVVGKFGSNQVARFYRPTFSRDDAVAELEGQPARAFLVRVAAADAVVISYVKPGNVIIHHRVFITPTGNLVPDGAAAGENFRTLHALLAAKGFVTPLDDQTPSSAASTSTTSSSAMPSPTIGYGNTPSLGAAMSAAASAAPPGSAVDALHAQPELARYFCTYSRERVCQLLGDAPDDTFMLRASSAGDGSIALSFKDRGNVRHCRILRDARGFFVDGDEDRAPTLVQVLRTFNFKIPDAQPAPAAPVAAEQTPTPGYSTPQQMFNMQLQPVAGYGGIPVGPDPSNACMISLRAPGLFFFLTIHIDRW
jgi:hypothetical protein